MNVPVLTRAGEIYSPFDPQETRRLRAYVSIVEELRTSTLFRLGVEGATGLTITGAPGGTIQGTLSYPGEEAVRAVVGLFRQVYKPSEPTSYQKTLNLLSAHVATRASTYRDAAGTELRRLRTRDREVRLLPMGSKTIHVEVEGSPSTEVDLTIEKLIDLFFYGKYLHRDDDKALRIDAWTVPEVAQYAFFGAITELLWIYVHAADIVGEVLRVSALVEDHHSP